jgi:hypothetical protein
MRFPTHFLVFVIYGGRRGEAPMATKHAAKPRPKANLSPELQRECTAILDLLDNEEDEHWQIGMHYNRIVDSHLYQADGFKNAHEFASKWLGRISQATLTRYAAIAQAFSEDVAKKYGSTLLEGLLTYERLGGTTLAPGDPGLVAIKVPNADGSTSNKYFAACSQDEMRAAVHNLHPPPKPIPPDDRPLITGLQKALERLLGTEPPIVMHAKRGSADTFVNFNLPMGYLEDLRDVLNAVLRKPGDAAVRSTRPKPRAKAASRNGRSWSKGDGRSRASKDTSMHAAPVHQRASGKAKQMVHRSHQRGRS